MEDIKLIDLLKNRFKQAEKFTKPFHEEVKRCLEDYDPEIPETKRSTWMLDPRTRYDFKIPYIFATHESMYASMFDQIPGLIFKGKGLDDDEKQKKITGAYEYLVDKLDVDLYMNVAAWWFILTGFTSGHASYKTETEEVPMLDEVTGEPVLDEIGQPVPRTIFIYDDPILEAGDPLKEYWSPESKFTEDGKKVPYYFKTPLMTVDMVKEVFGKKVEADTSLDADENAIKTDSSKKNLPSTDNDRVKVYLYYGTIPSSHKKDVKGWRFDKDFYIAYTEKEILYNDEQAKSCALGRLYGNPRDFFGFGIAKSLRQFQKELSIRRGQSVRWADMAAFAKLAAEIGSEIDKDAVLDPRESVVLLYKGQSPQYITPPPINEHVLQAEDRARQDAQFVSGMLDISKGGQQTTVDTATGQSIFAEAAERRIRQAKRQFGRFYRATMIMVLKLAQQNWTEDKVVSVLGVDGKSTMTVGAADLQDIDFDRDIDIEIESVSINKDVLRAQAIELYNTTKDDPLVDREEIIKDTMRDGFGKKNPDKYIQQPDELAMQGLNTEGRPQMGNGEQVAQGPQPTGIDVPTNPAGVMGGIQ